MVESEVRETVAIVFEILIGMVTQLNMTVVTKSTDWWYNSGTTIHVCNEKSSFKTYVQIEKIKEMMMGNDNFAKVMGI